MKFRTFAAASSGMTLRDVTALVKGVVRTLVAAPPDLFTALKAAQKVRPSEDARKTTLAAALRAGIKEVK